jgi:hypothetical protein
LSVRGSLLSGGHGGESPVVFFGCIPPSAGGDAVHGDGLLRRLDSSIQGGAPGAPLPCGAPQPGLDVNLVGSVVELAGSISTLVLDAVLQDGGSAHLSVLGAPGDTVLLLHALAGSGLWFGGLKGTLVPAVPLITLVIGPLPASGELSQDFTLSPVLPPGVDGVLLVNQTMGVPLGGHGLLGSASGSVLVRDLP